MPDVQTPPRIFAGQIFFDRHRFIHFFHSLMKTKDLIKFILPKIELVSAKKLKPAKWNPRIITDKRFAKLVEAIKDDPQFMTLRPILASKNGTIYAGNMRFRALQEIGIEDVPCVITDIPEKLAKLRSLKDNNHFGEYQMDELASLVVEFQPMQIELTAMPDIIMRQIEGSEKDHSATNKEEDVTFTANSLEHECPKCGFKFSEKE